MTPTAIRTVRTGRLLHITIDRPGRMNALGVDDLVALDTAISGAEATGARAIVLTGAGRAFCTGADLTAVTGEEPEVVMDAANRVIRGIVSAPIPVIAAVNGPAVGYGVALACAADLTYAAESAYFLLSFTSIGLMPDGGATALVAAAIGRARATELALLGQRLSATDAAQTGLVARILPDDQLAAHVEAVAGTLGAGPRRALELTRRALAASTLGHLDHALERYRITVFLGVPTMYQMMLTVPDLERRDLSHWRLGFFGAAPMPPTAVAKLVTTFPDVGFFQLCGPTEGGPTGIYSTPDEVAVRPDATGRWPITNAEFRLVDPDGNDVPTGMTGEIILRGETIMKGYWNKPEATAETIRDGWLHTGDLAVRDADGFITIVDRLKDMIITGGRNVYSIEVENALAGHPDVQDVAVVGLDHATFGETIVAIVTPVPGREVTLEELRTYAAEYVADYKLPRDLIVRDIPRNPSGKILKHVLRSEIRDDSAQRT